MLDNNISLSNKALKAVDKGYILGIRHELHRHPELAFELPLTTALVRRELGNLGIPYTESYGKSSITAFINPDHKGFSIGLRADMDALPIIECTGLPFSSEFPEKMHACGHDAHTAMLLGTARSLKTFEKELRCRVVLVFQACEEGELSGARYMVQDGLMNEMDIIVGMHVENLLECGQIGVCPGVSMAASRPIHIKFIGKTAHATLPQTGVNALAMAVSTYNAINSLLATQMDPFEKFCCSVGMLSAGSTDNVIPDKAEMKISLRTFSKTIEDKIVEKIRSFAMNAAEQQNGKVEFHDETKALPLINDPNLTKRVLLSASRIVGEENVVDMPVKLSSEDFSFYLSEKPGVFVRLGTRNETKGYTTMPHNNDFLIDEDALEIGSKVQVQLVLDNMNGISS